MYCPYPHLFSFPSSLFPLPSYSVPATGCPFSLERKRKGVLERWVFISYFYKPHVVKNLLFLQQQISAGLWESKTSIWYSLSSSFIYFFLAFCFMHSLVVVLKSNRWGKKGWEMIHCGWVTHPINHTILTFYHMDPVLYDSSITSCSWWIDAIAFLGGRGVGPWQLNCPPKLKAWCMGKWVLQFIIPLKEGRNLKGGNGKKNWTQSMSSL